MPEYTSPTFSVITAVFNDKANLELTADSLDAQTCRDFEWIIVDGGSRDGTVDWLQAHVPPTSWISEADKGIADAWNKGIERARGRFAVILNAGDSFDPVFLETMKAVATDDRIACCHARLADSNGTVMGMMKARPKNLWRGMHLPHNWCVVPIRMYREFGGYPLRKYAMDFEWFHRYFKKYGQDGFTVVPKTLGTYHLGGVSDSGYIASFKESERVLRAAGMNPVLARAIRMAYTLNHFRSTRIRSKGASANSSDREQLAKGDVLSPRSPVSGAPAIQPSIILMILPSLRISGGILEAIRLASDMRQKGIDARILSLWKHPHPVKCDFVPIFYLSEWATNKWLAPYEFAILLWRFFYFLRSLRHEVPSGRVFLFLTHFSTIPFGWFLPSPKRFMFLQGLEWKFLPQSPLSWALRKLIMSACRNSKVITANQYLSSQLSALGVSGISEASIWSYEEYCGNTSVTERPIDVVMVLRHGHTKQFGLYLELLKLLKQGVNLTSAVITPEDDIGTIASKYTDECLIRPQRNALKKLFQRSKIFVLLSEHEGFGLPPLEAMGAGCVPVCRDAGGIRCYMQQSLAENIIPLNAPIEEIAIHLKSLVVNKSALRRLSEVAIEVYKEGGAEARRKRAECLQLLEARFC